MKKLIHKRNTKIFPKKFFQSEDFKWAMEDIYNSSDDLISELPEDGMGYQALIHINNFFGEDISKYFYALIYMEELEKHTDDTDYFHSLFFVLNADKDHVIFVGEEKSRFIKAGDVFYLHNRTPHGVFLDIKQEGDDYIEPIVGLSFDLPESMVEKMLKKMEGQREKQVSIKKAKPINVKTVRHSNQVSLIEIKKPILKEVKEEKVSWIKKMINWIIG